MSKSNEILEEQIRVSDLIKKEREESNNLYARILVEKVVFTGLGLVLSAAVLGLLKLIFIK